MSRPPLEATLLLCADEYAFMGALIIQEVVRELLGKGLSGAKVLLLAGSRWAGQGLGWECGWKGEDGAEPGQMHDREAQHHGASQSSAPRCHVAGSCPEDASGSMIVGCEGSLGLQ